MRRADRVVAVGLLVFSGLVYAEAGDFPPDASMFPRLVAILTALLSLFLGAMGFLKGPAGPPPRPSGGGARARAQRVVLLLGGSVIYLAVTAVAGYIVATLLFLPALIFSLGVRRPLFVLVTTLAVVGIIWGVFGVGLKVPMPMGFLFE